MGVSGGVEIVFEAEIGLLLLLILLISLLPLLFSGLSAFFRALGEEDGWVLVLDRTEGDVVTEESGWIADIPETVLVILLVGIGVGVGEFLLLLLFLVRSLGLELFRFGEDAAGVVLESVGKEGIE